MSEEYERQPELDRAGALVDALVVDAIRRGVKLECLAQALLASAAVMVRDVCKADARGRRHVVKTLRDYFREDVA